MILLDTNVISALMHPRIDTSVKRWFQNQKNIHLYTSSLNLAEIHRGLMRLPHGKKRQTLEKNFVEFSQKAFRGRILDFDSTAAKIYGKIASQCEATGANIDVLDLMIAAVAETHGASIATRNVKDFKPCGVDVINPWEA